MPQKPILRRVTLLFSFGLLASLLPARADTTNIVIPYLSIIDRHHIPSTMLDPPPRDTGIAGAKLAIEDNSTTGQFLGQSFTLQADPATDEAAVLA